MMVLCFSAVLAWIVHGKFVSNQKQQKWKQRNKLIGGYLGIGRYLYESYMYIVAIKLLSSKITYTHCCLPIMTFW